PQAGDADRSGHRTCQRRQGDHPLSRAAVLRRPRQADRRRLGAGCAAMSEASITPGIKAVIAAMADTIAAHAEELTALDQAIGDGDHGLNMRRGFEAVRAEAEALSAKPVPEALKA